MTPLISSCDWLDPREVVSDWLKYDNIFRHSENPASISFRQWRSDALVFHIYYDTRPRFVSNLRRFSCK